MKDVEFRAELFNQVKGVVDWLQSHDPSVDVAALGHGERPEKVARLVTMSDSQTEIEIWVKNGVPTRLDIVSRVLVNPKQICSFRANADMFDRSIPFSSSMSRLESGNLANSQVVVVKVDHNRQLTTTISDLTYCQDEGPATSGYVGAGVTYGLKGEVTESDLVVDPDYDSNKTLSGDYTGGMRVNRRFDSAGNFIDYSYQANVSDLQRVALPTRPVVGEGSLLLPVFFRDIGGNLVTCVPTFPRRMDVETLFKGVNKSFLRLTSG